MNATTVSTHSAPRVTPNLRHAFGGIFRLTLRRFLLPMHWLTLAGLCGFLVLTSFPPAPNPAAAKIGLMPWIVMFYLTFIVPVMSFINAAGAMRDEMKAGNVDYVFTRPIPRPAFIGFKFLSHLACVQIDFLLSLATIVGIALYRQLPGIWDAVPALVGTQILVITAFSAFGFFCGIVTSRYIVVGLAYGAIIEVGVGQIPTQISKISMTHQVQAMLQPLMGGAANAAAAGAPELPVVTVGATIALLLGFTAIMLFLAGAIFSFLELSGPNEG
jgi:ABC-type transport system involved in multi-copper enzyme maturation permease subunit